MSDLAAAMVEFREAVDSGQYAAAAARLSELRPVNAASANEILQVLAWARLAVTADRSHIDLQLRHLISSAPYLCTGWRQSKSWELTG